MHSQLCQGDVWRDAEEQHGMHGFLHVCVRVCTLAPTQKGGFKAPITLHCLDEQDRPPRVLQDAQVDVAAIFFRVKVCSASVGE